MKLEGTTEISLDYKQSVKAFKQLAAMLYGVPEGSFIRDNNLIQPYEGTRVKAGKVLRPATEIDKAIVTILEKL